MLFCVGKLNLYSAWQKSYISPTTASEILRSQWCNLSSFIHFVPGKGTATLMFSNAYFRTCFYVALTFPCLGWWNAFWAEFAPFSNRSFVSSSIIQFVLQHRISMLWLTYCLRLCLITINIKFAFCNCRTYFWCCSALPLRFFFSEYFNLKKFSLQLYDYMACWHIINENRNIK